ncbi:ArnT family glycosyltransferase [Paraburkholderia hospita]|uniref:ArnT family glycosyltransferase n=1 Tax=Paraburkholderia hospita TaxID=169430 RepID=UPI000B34275C|nr:glycosyltransferase family 39 protein [Paraburkholderia hospita]OUL88675.1 hypothetical protein CA601_18080 [Paraburkholderia hospita]
MSTLRPAQPGFHLSSIVATLCSGTLLVSLTAAALAQFATPGFALLLGVLIPLLLVALMRALRETDIPTVKVVCFVAYSLAVLLWAWHYDSKQWGDLGVYYRCGTSDLQTAHTIREWMTRCQGKAIGETSAFWMRSLLYTLPFGAVFGNHYLLFKLFNALAHIATVFVLYRVVESFFNARTALITTVLFALNPEWWFTTTIAVGDNLSMLGLVVFFHAAAKSALAEKISWRWFLAAVFSFMAVDLVRTCGMIILAAMVLVALMSSHQVRRRVFGLALCLLLVTLAMGHAIEMFRLTPLTNQSTSVFGVLSGLDFSGDTSSMREYGWNQFYVSQIPVGHRMHEVLARMAEAFSSGFVTLIVYWFGKLQYLLHGNGYLALANTYGKYLLDDVPVPIHHMITNRVAVAELARGYGVGTALLAVTGLILRPVQALPLRMALAFAAAFLLMMVGVWEIQPRYVLLIIPALCLITANGFAAERVFSEQLRVYGMRLLITAGGFALVFLVALAGVRLAAKTYAGQLPQIHNVTQQAAYTDVDGKLCNTHALPIEITRHASRIMLPRHGEGCYSLDIEMTDLGREASFFVSRAATPTLWEMTYDPVVFELKEGGKIWGSANFTNVISQYVVVQSNGQEPAPKTRTFTLTIHNVNLEANGIEIRAMTRLRK